MDEAQLKALLEATLKEVLPQVVEATVEAKNAEKFAEIEKSLADVNKSIKLGFDSEEKATTKEVQKAVGKLFKNMKSVVTGARTLAEVTKEAFADLATKAPHDYLNIENNDEGAYLVPIEFAKEILRVASVNGLARKYSRIIPMGTDTKDISTLTNTVVAYWTSEGAAYTESKPTIGQVQLIAHKMTALISSTEELIDDQMTDQDIRTLMSELIGEAFAEFEDTNVFVSSTKFTPILTDSNVNIVTMGVGLGSFLDLTYDNLIDLVRAIATKYKKGLPRFFMHQDIMAIIDKLKDSNGDPLMRWMKTLETGLLSATLLGYPVEESEVFPGLTDDDVATPFILFGDMKFWAFGDRKKISFAAGYMSGNWEKDIQSLKANERIAGKIIFPKAFAVLKTGATT